MKREDLESLTLIAIYYSLEDDSSTKTSREKILTPEFVEKNTGFSDFNEYKVLLHHFQENGLIRGILFRGPKDRIENCIPYEDDFIEITPYGRSLAEKNAKRYLRN
ncbi:hypothetical protein H7K20_12655 [Priestia aryabhattai]|uniref:hypothetical protein n=1 Tax=Priestia TaxID=2800373 RepID=UPI001C8EC4BC|nr:hypothetical protein [Priestia aryabhattai]MBY0027952.1 hypothetical protein [Priestia aryabhattai]